jgi:hypothetical protein
MKWAFASSNLVAAFGVLLFASLPQTSTYKLQSYGFGSGGTANNTGTTTYSLNGISGELSGQPTKTGTASSNSGSGYIVDQQASVPQLASADNGSGQYYNKLHFVIDDTQGNTTNTYPTDTTFLISVSLSNTLANPAVSTSEFTAPLYLHPDGTLSGSYSTVDYQTYSSFGGTSGSTIIGLTQNTNYYIHLKATSGRTGPQHAFVESGYGPITAQATAPATISFGLSIVGPAAPPNTVVIPILDTSTLPKTSSQTINTTLTTNGASGGDVYIKGLNGGLKSGSTGYKIAALSTNLGTAPEGFGAQNNSVSQTSGSTYSVVAPYNVSGCVAGTCPVGIIDATNRSLYTATGPVTGGVGVLALLAKAASTDIAASDYQEVLTFTAAANF